MPGGGVLSITTENIDLDTINPNIKVLLSSGYSLRGQASDILARGCKGFIQKPFNMRELSHKLREVIEK